MDSNMKREIILDNYSHPFNRGTGGTNTSKLTPIMNHVLIISIYILNLMMEL